MHPGKRLHLPRGRGVFFELAQKHLKGAAAAWLNCSDICLLSCTSERRKETLVLRSHGENLRLRDGVCGEMGRKFYETTCDKEAAARFQVTEQPLLSFNKQKLPAQCPLCLRGTKQQRF